MSQVLVLDKETVRKLLPPQEAIRLMRVAMASASARRIDQRLRQVVPLRGDDGACYSIMPAAAPELASFGTKIISVFPHNFEFGIQSHQGIFILFEREYGRPIAIVHAGELTAIRTAAASAVATDLLARKDARHLAVFGYGEQAREHIRSLTEVRSIDKISIWGRSYGRAKAAAEELGARGFPVTAVEQLEEALTDADIVCTTTSASTPYLHASHISEAMHLNVVGSSTAAHSEVTPQLVARCRVFVDWIEMAQREAGEIIAATAAGIIADNYVAGEIGDILNGQVVGRHSETEVTMFKSLGMPAEDLIAAHFLYKSALKCGAGQHVNF